MSTYAVFGMTRHRAREAALKSTSLADGNGGLLTEAQWLEKVEKETDEIMAGTRVIQLSEKFDAPQYAEQFLEYARRSPSRDLHIKAYTKTSEVNPRTGMPVRKWKEYERVTKVA